MENNNPQATPLSEDTKTIITLITLCVFYPIGVVLMWMWTKWQSWVKWTITLLGLIPILLFGMFVVFAILASSTKDGLNPDGLNPNVPSPTQDQGLDNSNNQPDDGVWLVPVEGTEPRNQEKDGTMCTMDALECPDGSYVGRSGPNCEFVCPGDL